MVHPTLWINDPSWARLTIDPGWPAMYDITDDWLAANRANRQHRRLVTNENVLMSRCREVVVCSPGLLASKGRMRDVRLIPNAVDVARFSMPQQRPTDLPTAPIAMYVGTLHEDRLDVEPVSPPRAALDAVGAALVLVGPNALSAV